MHNIFMRHSQLKFFVQIIQAKGIVQSYYTSSKFYQGMGFLSKEVGSEFPGTGWGGLGVKLYLFIRLELLSKFPDSLIML
eukprot:snap_masked-scaffold_21-processed-gene-5.65-mRNA-1 protein AED:1.00 eAED:1.00 QI:0/0/0/0/1/1/3/0/79